MNTTFRLAPWADVLYAMDRAWWDKHIAEVRARFRGLLATPVTACHGVHKIRFDHQRNSGAGAVALAAHLGARRIVLLGYDGQKTGGRAHWHGDHPAGLGNAGNVGRWPAQFADLARKLNGAEIINASRETALTCWPRAALEDALCAS